MGENVFLMEPRNVYGAYPDYIVVDEDNIPIIVGDELLTIDREGMIKHHEDLYDKYENEMIDFRTRADEGPYQPDTASRLSTQIEDIKKDIENR